ncbi:M56 family metallopeptidase [Polaribacter sp. IC073]|uniref:M56 family metallopeptidase n=1 Tax=Polaribacter sp. IC073 TaxID=2508540 RepID=UPI0011BE016F|nr:M56 family metallopeptidase [Polaribacter sp. IC073]TXD48077.1 BlaR1 peptidase M56 [Polaribacter sp. IC073]
MINYILQVVLFQVLFLAIYDFFLSKETFFTKNRWYLLSTPVLSFLLPLIKIPTFQKAIPQEYIVYLPEIILSPEKVIQETSWYQSINYIDVLFGFGVLVFSVLFLAKLLQIINLIRTYKRTKKDGYTLVLIPKQTKAFSFFNYIFLGDEIPDAQKEQVIAHELVHSKQKHSFDLLFFEFLKIVMWFNPMIFIYQKRITLVHEYISDEVATKSAPKENYINQLLSNFFQVEDIAFINQFYKQTLIKKRIIMMKKKQSKKMNQLKYLVLIPVLISMLFYTSCSENSSGETLAKKELQTMYFNNNGEITATIGKKETYLDFYIGLGDDSLSKEDEVSENELSEGEKNEFLALKNSFGDGDKINYEYKVYKYKKGRKVMTFIPDFSKMKKNKGKASDGSVNFLTIEEAPTFPGCDSGDKDCFSKMILKHFKRDFNTALPNQLGLSAGKKRVFVGFKVNENGDVVGIQARGPHKTIEEEIIRVMNTLPKMKPGKQEGKKIAVSYNIPLVIVIE